MSAWPSSPTGLSRKPFAISCLCKGMLLVLLGKMAAFCAISLLVRFVFQICSAKRGMLEDRGEAEVEAEERKSSQKDIHGLCPVAEWWGAV